MPDLFNATADQLLPDHWEGSAKISPDGQYRWELRRWWSDGPIVAWLMLNPSTADAEHDDPTLRRVIGFSYRWGYAGAVVVNVYPYRSSKPANLRAWCGKGQFEAYIRNAAYNNADWVEYAARYASLRIVAFGAQARRIDETWLENGIIDAFRRPSRVGAGESLYCLGTSQSGDPLHPMARGRLRIPNDRQPCLWRAA